MIDRIQVDIFKRNVLNYTEELLSNYFNGKESPVQPDELRKLIHAAHISGILATSQVLAMKDGISISKVAEAARVAGIELTGSKPVPNS